MSEPIPRLKVQLYLDKTHWLGPGKAQILELIAETGSISAAGRRMGMSYKRAWMLVETLNTMFGAPLVESARGGAQGGGAHLTELGTEVAALFRRIETAATSAAKTEIEALHAMFERK